MPMVNGKKFPYTKAGKKAAKAARKKKSKKSTGEHSYQYDSYYKPACRKFKLKSFIFFHFFICIIIANTIALANINIK